MKQGKWDRVKVDIIHLTELFKENTLVKELAKYAEDEGIELREDIKKMLK